MYLFIHLGNTDLIMNNVKENINTLLYYIILYILYILLYYIMIDGIIMINKLYLNIEVLLSGYYFRHHHAAPNTPVDKLSTAASLLRKQVRRFKSVNKLTLDTSYHFSSHRERHSHSRTHVYRESV